MDRAWRQYAVHARPPVEILRPFSLPEKILSGPGPSNCSNRVLDVLGRQVLGHLHPEICQVSYARNLADSLENRSPFYGIHICICSVCSRATIAISVDGRDQSGAAVRLSNKKQTHLGPKHIRSRRHGGLLGKSGRARGHRADR